MVTAAIHSALSWRLHSWRCHFQSVYTGHPAQTARVASPSQSARGVPRAPMPGCSLLLETLFSFGFSDNPLTRVYSYSSCCSFSVSFSLFSSFNWPLSVGVPWAGVSLALLSFLSVGDLTQSCGVRYHLYYIFVDDACISQGSTREPEPVGIYNVSRDLLQGISYVILKAC